MIRRLPAVASIVVLSALVLAGCAAPAEPVSDAMPTPEAASPSAEPSPTASATVTPDSPPPVEELVLRPDGIGDLVIGTAEGIGDGPGDMIRFQDDYCANSRGEGAPPAGAPEADAWVLADEYRVGSESFAFGTAVVDEVLVAVQVSLNSTIRTEEGIGVGSSRAEVLKAHPSASIVLEAGASDVFEVSDGGRMFIEIGRAEADSVPGAFPEPDEVIALHAVSNELEPFAVWGTDYVMFPCS